MSITNSVEGFHSAILRSVTNAHPSIWKQIPLNEGRNFNKKRTECVAEQGDESTSKQVCNTVRGKIKWANL